MRILVACECSGVVRDAFAAKGWDAWSCDLKSAQGNHFHDDAMQVLRAFPDWDLMIAHPPCTHLSVSGALRFKEKQADGRQQEAIDFFLALINAPIPRICVENPVGIMSTHYRKPQYIQPYQFGHDASKKTGLWLKGLSPLLPTKYVEPRMVMVNGKLLPRWANQTDSGQNRLGPSAERAAIRAKTYEGIAKAMAEQWTDYIERRP